MSYVFGTLLVSLAIFLILLVLVQRGRGGGLTGALGGMGGSSAFGAKAGDVFTRITIVTAAVWICVCTAAVYWGNNRTDRLGSSTVLGSSPATTESAPAGPSLTPPATSEDNAADAKGADATNGAAPAGSAPASDAKTGDAPANP